MKPDEIMEEAVAEKQSHLFKPTLPIKETVEEAAKKYTESNTDANGFPIQREFALVE